MISNSAITFEPVTAANREECEGLRVATLQREFLPDNRSSIELAMKYPAAKPILVRNVDGQVLAKIERG